MTTLKLLKELVKSFELSESAFSIKRKLKVRNSKNSRLTKRHNFVKKPKSLASSRKSNKFHLIVNGVDRGVHVISGQKTRGQARSHFAHQHPGQYVQVRIIH